MLELSLTIHTDQFSAFVRNASAAVQSGLANPDLKSGAESAQMIYLADMQRRFVSNSQAGGEWRELSRYTRAERRRQGFNPARPILIRLGELFGALQRGAPGNVFEIVGDRLTAGIGGPALHSAYSDGSGGDGGITIAAIAAIHQQGKGRVPARRILHPPSEELLSRMTAPIVDGLRKLIYKSIPSGPSTIALNAAA